MLVSVTKANGLLGVPDIGGYWRLIVGCHRCASAHDIVIKQRISSRFLYLRQCRSPHCASGGGDALVVAIHAANILNVVFTGVIDGNGPIAVYKN